MPQQTQDPVVAWVIELATDLKDFLLTIFSPEILKRGNGSAPPPSDYENSFSELLDEITEQAVTGKRNPAMQRKLAALEQQVGSEKFRRRKDFNTFMEIVNRVYGPRIALMRKKLRELPIFAASRNAWTPGDATANNNISHILLREVNTILTDVFGFNPAPINITDRMRGDLDGLFNPKRRMVFINKLLFQKDFNRFFITYVHEQMHSLQFDLMERFKDPYLRGDLGGDLGYLVQYWNAEKLDYIKCFYLLNKTKKMPELYFRLGQEVHAEGIGQEVTRED